MLTVVPPVRENDLPVAWDGTPVTWGDPIAVGSVFICPPPKDLPTCPGCGQPHVHGADGYTGYVPGWQPSYWTRDERTGRPRKVPGWETRHPKLYLVRCLGCGHDQVTDLDTDETWDLDETDYGPDGSWSPEPEPLPIDVPEAPANPRQQGPPSAAESIRRAREAITAQRRPTTPDDPDGALF